MFIAALTCSAQLTGTLAPLATFGGGDGWLAPGEYEDYPYLLKTNLERGLAYGNGHLYLVSRKANPRNSGNNIRILDPAIGVDPNTQTDLGGLNIGTGIIAGGTFGVNMVGVGGDGAIYVGNLQTATNGSGGPRSLQGLQMGKRKFDSDRRLQRRRWFARHSYRR